MPMPPFLVAAPGAKDRAWPMGKTGQRDATLHEERNEILVAVLGSLTDAAPDPDQMAVCSRLLQHLSQTAGSQSRGGSGTGPP